LAIEDGNLQKIDEFAGQLSINSQDVGEEHRMTQRVHAEFKSVWTKGKQFNWRESLVQPCQNGLPGTLISSREPFTLAATSDEPA
jgi:hypothetical protein